MHAASSVSLVAIHPGLHAACAVPAVHAFTTACLLYYLTTARCSACKRLVFLQSKDNFGATLKHLCKAMPWM